MEDRYRKAASLEVARSEGNREEKARRVKKRSVSRSTIGLSEGGQSTPSYLKSDPEAPSPKARGSKGSKVSGVSLLGSTPTRGLGQMELPADDESD